MRLELVKEREVAQGVLDGWQSHGKEFEFHSEPLGRHWKIGSQEI